MNRKKNVLACLLILFAAAGGTCPTGTCPPDSTLPNPAVIEVRAEVVEALSGPSDTSGRVRIVVLIRNVGASVFDSGENQQSIQLFEANTLVANTPFGDLAVNGEASLTYERDWSLTDEFLPDYRGVITYDPDIFIDGNLANDDCTLLDNAGELTAAQVSAVLSP